MTYRRFEDLPVWKASVGFLVDIYAFTDAHSSGVRARSDLKSQLERAALSISNNIAEGFERGSTKELIAFLYIARGSAGEVRSMLCVIERLSGFDMVQLSELRATVESISRQLRAWLDKLQESDIKGQRHLTQDSRDAYDRSLAEKKATLDKESFLAEVRQYMEEHRVTLTEKTSGVST